MKPSPLQRKQLKVEGQPDRLAAMGIKQIDKIVSAIPDNVRHLICELFTEVSAPRVAAILQGAREDYFTGQSLQHAFSQCQSGLPEGPKGRDRIAQVVWRIAREDMPESEYREAVHIHRSDKTSEQQRGKPLPAYQIEHRTVARNRNNGEKRLEAGTLFAGGREWTRDELGQLILLADSRDTHESNDPSTSKYRYLSTKKLAEAMITYADDSSISPEQIRKLLQKLKDIFHGR